MPRRNPTGICKRRAGEAGFTLLELLVALTLLSLVFAVVFGELRFAARAWDAADAKLERDGEVLTVHAFLRQRFQQIHVTAQNRPADDAESPVVFDGSSRAMVFLAPMPAIVSDGGFYQLSLSSETGATGNDLFLSWRPFDEDGVSRVADGPDNSRVLLRGIREVQFSYFGQTSDGVAPQWWDTWPARDAAPSLIRMRVSFDDGDRRNWPELVVAPASTNIASRQP